jgi:mono/diheme cytochrome c family protein
MTGLRAAVLGVCACAVGACSPSVDFERMRQQQRVDAYAVSMRVPPRGTVPLESRTAADAAQGQHQFEVFCAVCHGSDGTGQSVMSADMPGTPPPSLLSGSAAERSDTESATIIANGIHRMPGYAWALSAPERDAIVAYMRRLQQSARGAAGTAR